MKESKVHKEGKETVKKTKNKKKKTKEPPPLSPPPPKKKKETTTTRIRYPWGRRFWNKIRNRINYTISLQANPKSKHQDEENLQPADSLNSILGYFNKTFEAMQNQINQKYNEPLRKSAVHNDYSF